MKLLTPPSKSTRRLYPCSNCQAPTAVEVVTKIESEEEIADFMARRLNRANCSFCYCPVEAPVRVVVRIPEASYLDHECIPTGILESPEVVGEVGGVVGQRGSGGGRGWRAQGVERADVGRCGRRS